MLVSFLVPVYNVGKYLDKCIDSILVQAGCDFEIVLLDDGSTDSSGAICDRYAQQYPDIIRVIHKTNEGLLMTRRRGFAEAKGDWFICVDSDDSVAPDLLEKVVSAIEKTGVDMVMYNFEYVDEQGNHTPSRLRIPDGEIFEGEGKQRIYEKRLLSVDINMMWMRAIKREILDLEVDYSTCGIRNMCEDAVQVLALYTNAERIVYLKKALYYYRKGSDSITSRNTLDNWQASERLFAYTQQYLALWNVSEAVKIKFYTNHLEYLCNYVRWLFSAEEQERSASLKDLVSALRKEPGFILCRQNYKKELSTSRYLSIVVPVLTRFVEKENLLGIRLILLLEKGLLKLKKFL